MKGTNWKKVIRSCAGEIHRELRITLSGMPHPKKWVFLVGCYNSGTTLLRKILGSHALISALPAEGQYLTDQLPSDNRIGLSRMWVQREDIYRLTEEDTGPDAIRIQREWGMRLDRSMPIYLDQTPANSARTRWLQKNFENAYFIGMVRNGYAVAEGIVRKARPIHTKDGWTVEQAAYQWSRSNEILEQDSRYLDHFMWLSYEEFTENPDKEFARILAFLEVTGDKGIGLDKNWSVHERNQQIRNMNAESISRLTPEQIVSVSTIAGDVLEHFGYPLITHPK